MARETFDTHAKALRVNLDPLRYGTYAEIGAGQEVARWFFRVGGAAGTVAKAMSAYDMTFSDTIYGHSERVAPHLRHLYAFLLENQRVESLRDVDPRCLPVFSRDVLDRLRSGDHSWEEMTPPAVAELIKRRGLLGYRAEPVRRVS